MTAAAPPHALPPPAAPPPGASAPRRPVITRWLLALLVTLHALLVVAQPVLIGGYLQGNFDLLSAHSLNGTTLPGSAFLALLAAVVYWARRGRAWPVVALAALWFAEFVQMVVGHTRGLWVHVPLGVAIVGTAVVLAVWSWTRAAGRPRQGWWR